LEVNRLVTIHAGFFIYPDHFWALTQ